jgi:hypothetical protein
MVQLRWLASGFAALVSWVRTAGGAFLLGFGTRAVAVSRWVSRPPEVIDDATGESAEKKAGPLLPWTIGCGSIALVVVLVAPLVFDLTGRQEDFLGLALLCLVGAVLTWRFGILGYQYDSGGVGEVIAGPDNAPADLRVKRSPLPRRYMVPLLLLAALGLALAATDTRVGRTIGQLLARPMNISDDLDHWSGLAIPGAVGTLFFGFGVGGIGSGLSFFGSAAWSWVASALPLRGRGTRDAPDRGQLIEGLVFLVVGLVFGALGVYVWWGLLFGDFSSL